MRGDDNVRTPSVELLEPLELELFHKLVRLHALSPELVRALTGVVENDTTSAPAALRAYEARGGPDEAVRSMLAADASVWHTFIEPPLFSEATPTVMCNLARFADVQPGPEGVPRTLDAPFTYVMQAVQDQRGLTTVERLHLTFFERMFDLQHRVPALVRELGVLSKSRSYPSATAELDRWLDKALYADTVPEPPSEIRSVADACREALGRPDDRGVLYVAPRISQVPVEHVRAVDNAVAAPPPDPGKPATHEARRRAVALLAAADTDRETLELPVRLRLGLSTALLARRKFVKTVLLENGWPEVLERSGRNLPQRLRDLERAVRDPEHVASLTPWWRERLADERLVDFLRVPPYFDEIFTEELASFVAPTTSASAMSKPADDGVADQPYTEALLSLTAGDGGWEMGDQEAASVHARFDTPAGSTETTARIPVGLLRARLEELVGAYQRPISVPGTRAVTMTSRDPDDLLQEIGNELWNALFRDGLSNEWLEPTLLRRTLVRLRVSADDRTLLNLPWECLRLPMLRVFAGQTLTLSVVRHVPDPVSLAARRIARPLRILVAAASPTEMPLPGKEQEIELLQRVLEPSVRAQDVRLEVLRQTSVSDLQQRLRTFQPHVFHFLGHGAIVEGRGTIVFADQESRPELVDAEQVGVALQDNGILVAVLNGCDTAVAGEEGLAHSVAQVLVRKGVPMVVATSRVVVDDHALWFAGEFYRALADGFRVEAAVVEARKALGIKHWDWSAYVVYASSGFPLDDLRLGERQRTAVPSGVANGSSRP